MEWKFYENFEKKDWIDNLIDQESHLYFFARDDAIKTARCASQIKVDLLEFNELYKLSVDDLIRQFSQNLSKNKMWILDKICDDNAKIYNKIQQRLANNIKNLFDEKRKNNILHTRQYLVNSAKSKMNNDPLSLILAEEEAKIEVQNKKDALKKYKKTIQKITKAEKIKNGYQLLFAF